MRIFSDEKCFTVDQARNCHNDRYLADSPASVPPINRTKHPASVMMLGVVGSDGKKMDPYWFPKGIRVGTKEYLVSMKLVVEPWLRRNYPGGNYVWQQDSAPGHASKETQKWISENLAAYWKKELWPPSSPDLNPLDLSLIHI